MFWQCIIALRLLLVIKNGAAGPGTDKQGDFGAERSEYSFVPYVHGNKVHNRAIRNTILAEVAVKNWPAGGHGYD